MKALAAVIAAVLAAFTLVYLAQPELRITQTTKYLAVFDEEKGIYGPTSLCNVYDCYWNGSLVLELPEIKAEIITPRIEGVAVSLFVFLTSLVALGHAAYKLENITVKKAIAIFGMIYGAGLTILTAARRDFKLASPILLPLALALLGGSTMLYLLLRASGKKIAYPRPKLARRKV